MTEDTAPAERFTDEEYAFLRYVRFGTLPPRVLPAEMVEEVDTDSRPDVPEGSQLPHRWGGSGHFP
ncbi:hypothetical protein Sru01_34920 [Sphaerisporangium rufum]|uniref:Uncharacterized protein n=1 Tax=Sphaerisporangium rufum TaxID=1381558 RepID=A0A919V5P2_9ACTN|nr:hypothetical protein [Sphaerisporangium rufum]GII78510.1 hypothetical protein Sru01_34920 [Sphaerisporangium rufum]